MARLHCLDYFEQHNNTAMLVPDTNLLTYFGEAGGAKPARSIRMPFTRAKREGSAHGIISLGTNQNFL